MVGYQGLSSRSSSQRQSGANGRATQTGTPSAPARWAMAVSEVMTRSRFFMTAAVSMKAPVVSSSRLPRSVTGKRPATARSCSRPAALLQAEQVDAGTRASGANWVSGMERRRSAV